MAKNQTRNTRTSRASESNMGLENEETMTSSSVPAHQGQSGEQTDLMSSITPAIQNVQRFIDGNPVRAAAIGAIAGGAIMSLFATEKGRSFAKMAYGYANPMISKYVKEYVSKAAGDLADNALAQH